MSVYLLTNQQINPIGKRKKIDFYFIMNYLIIISNMFNYLFTMLGFMTFYDRYNVSVENNSYTMTFDQRMTEDNYFQMMDDYSYSFGTFTVSDTFTRNYFTEGDFMLGDNFTLGNFSFNDNFTVGNFTFNDTFSSDNNSYGFFTVSDDFSYGNFTLSNNVTYGNFTLSEDFGYGNYTYWNNYSGTDYFCSTDTCYDYVPGPQCFSDDMTNTCYVEVQSDTPIFEQVTFEFRDNTSECFFTFLNPFVPYSSYYYSVNEFNFTYTVPNGYDCFNSFSQNYSNYSFSIDTDDLCFYFES
jgi:hypothetical protein